jgi:hypothetical protein
LNKVPNCSETRSDFPGSDTPSAKVRPSGSVVKLNLHKVHFSLKITKVEQKPKQKRLKPNLFDQLADLSEHDVPLQTTTDPQWMLVDSDDDREMYRREACDNVDSITGHENTTSSTSVPVSNSLKRMLQPIDTIAATGVQSSIEDELASLVDASIRVSISKRPCNLSPGIKILETFFIDRLADIFPVTWKPHYLEVITLKTAVNDKSAKIIRHLRI